MAKKVVVLGSTGSLGMKTLELIEKHQKYFKIVGLSANQNAELLNKQVQKFRVKNLLLTQNKTHALENFAAMPEADIIVNVLSGSAGISPSIAALMAGKTLLIGNKESLVAEGKKMIAIASKRPDQIIPLDSEHNAIYEILKKFPHKKLKYLIIPCSGGPFWHKRKKDLERATVNDTLNHPKWKMGKKITVESATLINKGLELIEAHFLFNLPLSKIKVAIHPDCKIHGAVEFTDGTKYAYLAEPDMQEHIENALLRAAKLTPLKRKIVKLTKKLESDLKILKEFPTHLPGIQIVLNAFQGQPGQMEQFLKKEEVIIDKFLNDKLGFQKIFEQLRLFRPSSLAPYRALSARPCTTSSAPSCFLTLSAAIKVPSRSVSASTSTKKSHKKPAFSKKPTLWHNISVNYAIILAAGQGERFKAKPSARQPARRMEGEGAASEESGFASSESGKLIKYDKLLLPLDGHPIIYYPLITFNEHPGIREIILVANKSNKKFFEQIVKTYRIPKVKKITLGGLTRQKSFEAGFKQLEKIAKPEDVILVHNADNPLVSLDEISETITQAESHGACIVGKFLTSTIKEVDDEKILNTKDRAKLFAAETPQAAKFHVFKKALKNAQSKNLELTDEAMLLEAIGQKVAYVKASDDNFKITTQADYHKLKSLFGDLPEDFRVGIGQDSHAFEQPKAQGNSSNSSSHLILGGLELKQYSKLQANSDGDVILHAIFNAISQAIGERSLGFYADEACEKGVKDSKKYLEIILKKMRKEKFKLNSLGIMLECKQPKIDPLVAALKKSLSKILDLDPRRIGITATSGENLTAFGRGVGIQCFAIVSLKK